MKTIIRQGIRFGALAASLLGATSASAQVTQSYCITDTTKAGGFKPGDKYDPLMNPSGTLVVVGTAAITPEGTILLTNSINFTAQTGNVTTKDQVDFSYTDAPANTKVRPFHSFFSFSIGTNTGMNAGAGLAFLAHNGNPGEIGSSGTGLGYAGIANSFALEFDTFPDNFVSKVTDPKDNHIGFMLDGKQTEHLATFIPKDNGTPIPFATATKDKFYVWIDYAGGDARQLDVYFSKTKDKPVMPIQWDLHKTEYASDTTVAFPDSFNMADWFAKAGAPTKAFIGFSAATYSDAGEDDHIIHEWEFSTTEDIPCKCQGPTACAGTESTHACSAGPGTKDDGICVECTPMDQGACTAKQQVCNPDTETCVGCNVGMDCPPDNPVCDPASHSCGPCMTDDQCNESHPDAPYCSDSGPLEGTCVECKSDADCKGAEPVCDKDSGMCILPCSKDLPCPAGWMCNEAAGRCEQCTEGDNCPPPSQDVILGGGCGCSVIGLTSQEGLAACLLSALGIASAVARRRRRS